MSNLAKLKEKFRFVWKQLDERGRRLVAAAEAKDIGRGGITLVHQACGLSRNAIARGITEIENEIVPPPGHVRRAGGGRKSLSAHDPTLHASLAAIIDSETRGDPESVLLWTCKSTRTLAGVMNKKKHRVSHTKVAQILHEMDYSLQSNRKTLEGADHEDRDAQFRHINRTVKKRLALGEPVISVDTKKKELIGNYDNAGRQWLPEKQPIKVQGHDFPKPEVPRAYPYGIYDFARNTGFVSVGTDHDTGAFAVASIRGWWRAEGRRLYAGAKTLMITADGGGSNGWRLRLWKSEMQKLADETGLSISVSHFPPGTSKWNKVEHRLFSFISSNWRGKPLVDYETIVNLIANTTTAKGLKVTCRLDRRKYQTGRKVTDEEMQLLNIERNKFHGEWNYVIKPRLKM